MVFIFLQKLATAGGDVIISYKLAQLTTFHLHYDMGITTNPIPENNDENTILVKVTGNSTINTISWTIKDPIDNNSLTTGSGVYNSVKTIWEQLSFFDKVFQASSINDVYRISIADNFSGTSTYTNEYFRKEGALTDMDFTLNSLTPVSIDASVDLQVGSVVTTLDADTPSEPLNITATDVGSHHVSLTWSTPTDAGGSAITGYVIQRKTQLTSYQDVITTAITNSIVDTSPPKADHYWYRIAAISNIGRGLYSDEKDLDVA